MWVCVEPDTDKDRAFVTQLEVALIYLFDDCFEQVVQQPEIDDLCDLFISTTRDVATGKISEWGSSMFVAKGASAALAEDMSMRLEIIKGILAVDEQLMSPKLLTHSKRIDFETLDKFHEEAAHWRRLCAGQFTTDEEYVDMKNYVCYMTPNVLPPIEDDEIQCWNFDSELLKVSNIHIALRNVCWSWPKEFNDLKPLHSPDRGVPGRD